MAIKNRLKVILAEKNIQPSKLADMIDVGKSTISNILNHKQNCTLEMAIDIAHALGEPVERIFYKEVSRVEVMLQIQSMLERADILYKTYESLPTYADKENSRDDISLLFKFMILEFTKEHGKVMTLDIIDREPKLQSRINPVMRNVIEDIRNDIEI